MSLQGTLETFALPDVLVLLSSTKKDGELRVVGGRIDGRVWLEKGQFVHANISGNDTEPVDAVFELLRLETGTFNFDNESAPPKKAAPEPVEGVLADAQVRLGEWNEIAKVVPHLDAVVDMAEQAPGDEVTVTRDQWSMLRRVAGGRSVNDLMVALGRSEYDTCKTVKELVDAKLASVDVDPEPKAKAAPEPAKTKSADFVAEVIAKAEKQAKAEQDRALKPKPDNAKVDPGERQKVAASTLSDDGESDTVAASEDDLQALAELASRRKIRASTSTEAEPGTTGARPAATKSLADKPVEEAKALVAQLAALSGEEEAEVAAKVTEHLASGGELPEVPEGDEPINRGLLLKFLSSVRN